MAHPSVVRKTIWVPVNSVSGLLGSMVITPVQGLLPVMPLVQLTQPPPPSLVLRMAVFWYSAYMMRELDGWMTK